MRLEYNYNRNYFNPSQVINNNYINNSYLKLNSVPHSRYREPIDQSIMRLSGFSREAGGASLAVKDQVRIAILEEAQNQALTPFDKATLLAIAEHESGFNPDAAAKESSASGIFQIIKGTAEKLGLPSNMVFDARANIRAGITLYKENLKLVNQRYPSYQGADKVAMLYALHHDGPSLKYGGWDLAQKHILPKWKKWSF